MKWVARRTILPNALLLWWVLRPPIHRRIVSPGPRKVWYPRRPNQMNCVLPQLSALLIDPVPAQLLLPSSSVSSTLFAWSHFLPFLFRRMKVLRVMLFVSSLIWYLSQWWMTHWPIQEIIVESTYKSRDPSLMTGLISLMIDCLHQLSISIYSIEVLLPSQPT